MIQRYDLYGWEGNKMVEPDVVEDPKGDWVKHSDHQSQIDSLRCELERWQVAYVDLQEQLNG